MLFKYKIYYYFIIIIIIIIFFNVINILCNNIAFKLCNDLNNYCNTNSTVCYINDSLIIEVIILIKSYRYMIKINLYII